MNEDFKQKIILAIITGLFVLFAAYVSSEYNSESDMLVSSKNDSYSVVMSPSKATASGFGSSAVSNQSVSIVDNRVSANGDVVVNHGGNVNVNQSINNNMTVNGVPYNESR